MKSAVGTHSLQYILLAEGGSCDCTDCMCPYYLRGHPKFVHVWKKSCLLNGYHRGGHEWGQRGEGDFFYLPRHD